jgi:hypothetical protein
MPLMKVRPMTEEEEKAGDYPDLQEGTYYPGTVKSVDYFRNKEGRIVGLAPAKIRDGQSAHPWGQIRVAIKVKLDDFEKDYTIGVPLPLNEEKCKPWNGPFDDDGLPVFGGDGKALGEGNTFTEDEIAPFMKPLRTGGTMKNSMAIIAEKFGWKPFKVYATDVMVNGEGEVVLDAGKPAPISAILPAGVSVVKSGQPIRQWLDLSVLLQGKRVMVGKIREKDSNGKPKPFTITDIIPTDEEAPVVRQTKDPQVWVGELLAALKDQKLTNGQPFTVENALDAAKGQPGLETVKPNTIAEHLTPAQWAALGDVLAQSCINRSVVPPSKYIEEAKAEVKGV